MPAPLPRPGLPRSRAPRSACWPRSRPGCRPRATAGSSNPVAVNRAAFLYDDDAYVETIARPQRAKAGGPVGLMGRQVAGKEFLDAYLTHGRWTELVAMVRTRASADSLARLWQTHPACGA